jgi:Holliday junction resolvase RusA-like endonuclease
VEVILFIAITEKRYKTVDVDNLSKAVLDSLNGIAYEDDSQVASLICKKSLAPL